jgi:hypothetical protein
MKLCFTWLIALAVMLGMHGRAFAVDPCDVVVEEHSHDHNHRTCDQHGTTEPCGSSHDSQCPLDHHHHHHHEGCLCKTMPVADANDCFLRLNIPHATLSRFRHEGDVAPEAPCLDQAKPPLI